MKKLILALDWTANTNHTGFYVAQEEGFYSDEGLEVSIETPDMDNYEKTPVKKVELGEAHLALCPFESILSYNTKANAFDAVAIAAIFREDVSAIVTLKGSGITSPKDLDGKSYASYKARYEDAIVKQMIVNDGGQGELAITYPEKLGIWQTLLSQKCDATWVFMNWEGLHAQAKGITINAFRMSDYGIPYGYSPVIMANKKKVLDDKEALQKFLSATKRGFLFAQEQPEHAVAILSKHIAETDSDIDVLKSQVFSNTYYGNIENWGVMKSDGVNAFLDWIYKMGFEKEQFQYDELVINMFG